MRNLIVLPLFLLCCIATAQNVGVGTATPTEKLDVNGNLNINGKLKVNGNAGSVGDVLTVNSSGNTGWANVGNYKNFRTYSSDAQFIVPPDATEIMFEVWGAGGGGAAGGGGGSGAYAVVKLAAVFGAEYDINVGTGGNAAPTNGSAGGGSISQITSSGSNIISAYGGSGASVNFPGNAGTLAITFTANRIIYHGRPGKASKDRYGQYNSTQFYTAIEYGSGGDPAFGPGGGGEGGFRSFVTGTATQIKLNLSTSSASPGAGGGGGQNTAGTDGSKGGDGFVIVRW